ncbi:glucan synthesis regulatory protein [Coprinopsis cinerea okayama7|uniref:Glucan synthesis regulatory protein n=1 Tax=Coprinopsis cinerea (strain Okayama-7 / 130 / ATCC MYA-4618 / FGSC 9003) TaxID=240176 RepID=A8NH18_COPC7|nr:glucan synthesis regulatory protein [Coprinopsis cinerea okayama7\|eukprot:XP_001833657.2 glucan synthesis regulatory protein [Coprinopsis cinerea okayama7\
MATSHPPSRPGSSSLLPTHMDPMHPQMSPNSLYPPLSQTWNRIRVWLNREYPELGDTLNYGILPQDLAEIEMQMGLALPPAVRESYLCVDGQEPESAAGCSEGLFFGLTLLPLESVLEEWRFWREVDEDSTTGANPKLLELMQSIPPRWIRLEYSNRGWVPLIADKAGNYVGVDLNPAEEGAVGQVIIFGRDFDTKVVLWHGDGPGGWGKWLAAFADELESGDGFELGYGDNSEGSEDDVGYESYYHDGSGRGAGDGGGASGTAGGLRLTGEFRGWNVLEAWGEKSLRKWYDAGLLPEFSYQQEPATENVGLGVYEGPAETSKAAVSEVETPIASTSSHAPTSSRPTNIPTISVTKPPAPRPVDLPTQQDINPSSPPESMTSSDDYDLESGRGSGLQGYQEAVGLVSNATGRTAQEPLTPLFNGASESSVSALPLSPPPPLDTSVSSSKVSDMTPTSKTPATAIPDLMAESTPVIAAVPIQPSTSTQSQLNGVQQDDSEDLIDTRSIREDDDASASSEDAPGAVAETSSEATPANPTSSEASSSAPGEEPAKTHKKNKSSVAELKKSSQRKDSSASLKSVKDASPPTAT